MTQQSAPMTPPTPTPPPTPPMTPPSTSRRGDPLALGSVIAGAGAHLLSLISTVVTAVASATGLFDLLGVVNLASTVVVALLAIAALVLGGIALFARRPPTALAGAGTALGTAALLIVLAAAVYPLVFRIAAS